VDGGVARYPRCRELRDPDIANSPTKRTLAAKLFGIFLACGMQVSGRF
jgi:hypothetical protein